MKTRYSFLLLILILALGQTNAQEGILLEEIWQQYKYMPKSVPGFRFMEDGRHYTKLENNTIKKYDLLTGEAVEDILNGADIKDQSGFSGNLGRYNFNNDESKILLQSNTESIYRRSSKAYFHIYDRETKSVTSIFDEDKIMYATLSPDGKKVAYVWENNLYYLDLESGITLPITEDGEFNKIINGSADWVYEEEFSFAKAFFWSPDSRKIAFQRFDETEVSEFTMTNYRGDLYPEYQTFKYPKVGEKNSVVSVHIYDLESEKTIDVTLSESEELYVPRVKWTKDPNLLFVYTMNRHQSHLQVWGIDATTGKGDMIIYEKNKYYIDITDDIRFLENGKEFIWSSEKSGYNHLYLYDIEGNEKLALTQGDYDVTRFYGIDEKRGRIYYQSCENGPPEKQVYSIGLDGKSKNILAGNSGTNSAQFSSTFDYYVNTHSTMNAPSNYTVFKEDGTTLRILETNENLKSIQTDENVSEMEMFSFTTSENVELNGWMIKPQNFNPEGNYPLFMYVYGGPGSQLVTNSWKGQNYWWFQMLAQQGYVVACVDNRGTGGRGEEFKKMTYLQLGKYETIDQIEAAKYLGGLDYIDGNRIGIFGWSYGGYMSSLCLFKGHEVFKAAIAVAPVTNWKWYDTIYTERYMRTEEENPDGYADNSPVNFTDLMEGNYLLVHGMGDDNVHFQNTAEMVNALVRSNKQFDTYFYPNRNHGIFGGNTRFHLYKKMTEFILNNI